MAELDPTSDSSDYEYDYGTPNSDSSEEVQSMRDPAQVLPMELMGEIFTYHASTDWKAPLKLSLVCRNWTKILDRTPYAWAFLQINKWDGLYEESLQTWLSKARNSPLRFHFLRSDSLPTLRMCSNIRALEYEGQASALNKLELPTLRYLSLRNHHLSHYNRPPPPPPDLRNLSRSLTTLDVTQYYLLEELKEKIPASITDLHIHPRFGIHSIQLMEPICLRLSTLCVHTDAYYPLGIDSQEAIILPNLQKLVIHWGFPRSESGRMVRFINNIHTPRLRIFHETGARTCNVSVQRSYELRSTITEYITEDPYEEGSFPQELDNVEILRISCKIPNPTRVPAVPQCNMLSQLAGSPNACPKLKELELFVGAEKRMAELKGRIERDIIKIANRDPPPRMQTTLIFGKRRWANMDLFSAHVDNVSIQSTSLA